VAAQGTHSGGLAERYATALLELADERKDLDRVASDLATLKALLAESADLRRLAASPIFSRQEAAKAMAALLDRSGVGKVVGKFIGLVARNRRLFALGRMIRAFETELARRRGEVVAEVVAAQALTPAQASALDEALRHTVGGGVKVDLRVDRALIGGLTVKIGSRLFDGSLKTKLGRLQLAMKGIG